MVAWSMPLKVLLVTVAVLVLWALRGVGQPHLFLSLEFVSEVESLTAALPCSEHNMLQGI